MKKYNHPNDDFLRELLKDHKMTPSEEAKQAFLKEILAAEAPARGNKKGIILLSVIAVITTTVILLWGLTKKEQDSPSIVISGNELHIADNNKQVKELSGKQPINSAKTDQPQLTNVTKPTPESNNQTHINFRKIKSINPYAPVAGISAPVNTITPHLREETKELSTPVLATQENSKSVNTTEIQEYKNTPITEILPNVESASAISDNNNSAKNNSDIKPLDTLNYNSVIEVRTAGNFDSVPRTKLTSSTVSNRKWGISAGGYYTPEWVFNTLERANFLHNFGLEGTFRIGRMSVRTGAGLSIGKGTNELVVAYNDFLGTYNKLDSMKFAWNDPIQNYLPTIYTSKKDVWDSLMALDYPKVVKRYTYLQVPLIFGYDFWQNDFLSLGVRVGPVMSVLIVSKQLSAAYDPGMKRIISINDISPGQINLNWQVMAGLGASFIISRNLRFEVEPALKYYFNSVYEKPVNNTKPWSVGVRAAVLIDL